MIRPQFRVTIQTLPQSQASAAAARLRNTLPQATWLVGGSSWGLLRIVLGALPTQDAP